MSDLAVFVGALIGDGLAFDAVARLFGLSGLEVRQAWIDAQLSGQFDTTGRRFGPVCGYEKQTILFLHRRGMPAIKIAHILRRRQAVIKRILAPYYRNC